VAAERPNWNISQITTTTAFGFFVAPSIYSRDKWPFVAWVFGRGENLKELSSLLVNEITTHGTDQCLALAGAFGPMPTGLVGRILVLDLEPTIFQI